MQNLIFAVICLALWAGAFCLWLKRDIARAVSARVKRKRRA